MEADGAVDAQNAPTVPWKTLCVFHELPQGLSNQITHEKPRKAPKWRWETRIDPIFVVELVLAIGHFTSRLEYLVCLSKIKQRARSDGHDELVVDVEGHAFPMCTIRGDRNTSSGWRGTDVLSSRDGRGGQSTQLSVPVSNNQRFPS